MKRFLIMLLTLALIIIPLNGVSILANTNQDDNVLLNPKLDEYVNDIIKVHFYSTEYEFDNYTISKPFILKNVDEETDTVCYLIQLDNGTNKILEVAQRRGKLYSTLSDYFADELLMYLNERNIDGQLFTDGNHVIITDGQTRHTLFTYDKNVKISQNLNSDLPINVSSYVLNSINNPTIFNQPDVVRFSYRDRPEPTNYRHLRVRPIRQERANWCWAACTAMGINYSTRYNVSQRDVVSYVFGRLVDEPASGRDVIYAYENWGIRASSNYNLNFRDVIYEIERDRPIILGLATGSIGHMVIVRGFDDWYGSDWSSDQVIRMIDPYDGREFSSTYSNDDYIRYNGGWERCIVNITQ